MGYARPRPRTTFYGSQITQRIVLKPVNQPCSLAANGMHLVTLHCGRPSGLQRLEAGMGWFLVSKSLILQLASPKAEEISNRRSSEVFVNLSLRDKEKEERERERESNAKIPYLTNARDLLLCEAETRQGSISWGARLPLTPFGAPQHVQMLVSSHFDAISHQSRRKINKNGGFFANRNNCHSLSRTFVVDMRVLKVDLFMVLCDEAKICLKYIFLTLICKSLATNPLTAKTVKRQMGPSRADA
uniref:SFRICE_027690 n=1 Tax=Spodoptera frugiperda TaxID=7108 RepID=A0A2H1WAP3_SPOFR